MDVFYFEDDRPAYYHWAINHSARKMNYTDELVGTQQILANLIELLVKKV